MAASLASQRAQLGAKLGSPSSKQTANTSPTKGSPVKSHVCSASKSQAGRWRGMDAGHDQSDDQQDIARGRGMVDSLFQGGQGMGGTQNAIMSSQDYISNAQRSFNNIEEGFYISPAFLDKISIHVAKNFMDLPKIKVPLILGIWGGKGQGKTFQCMLAFKKLGITPIVMSAGELESGNAGEPAKLIRQRYREASDIIKKGKMCALFINDLDAGAGRFGMTTQYTVNNQMVNATLMNIADNPTNVQLPGVYKNEDIPRVPIIATGNDFSTLYAPLIRDGRMEKYYWNPTREDRIGVCMGIFHDDGVTRGDVEKLVDTFPGQSIDFFGALRARVYDDKVRQFVSEIGHEGLGKRLINSKQGTIAFEKPKMGLDILMQYGRALVGEQDNVKRVQLADAYLAGAELAGSDGSSVPENYDGAKGLKLGKNNASSGGAGWSSPDRPQGFRAAPAPAQKAAAPAPAPTTGSWRSAPTPAAAPAASTDRWANVATSRGGNGASSYSAGGSSAAGGDLLSASDLVAFKVDDLATLARKKGVELGKAPSRDTLTAGLLEKRLSLADLSVGQLAELGAKLGKTGLPRDADKARAELRPLLGKGGSASSASSGSAASWRSAAPAAAAAAPQRSRSQSPPASWIRAAPVSNTPAPASRSSGGDRWASYGGRGASAAAPASSSGSRWERASSAPATSRGSAAPSSGSSSSSGARLSNGDLSGLRIDDLRELAAKVGAALPREPTKDALISALVTKGVSLDHMTRGMLVDLCTKLGAPLAKDADSMRRNLSSMVGKGSSRPAASSSSSSVGSWRSGSSAATPAAPASGGRFSSYSAGSTQKASWRRSGAYSSGASAGGAGKLSTGDLSGLRIDDLRELAKKTGAALPREPTKDALISALVTKGVSLDHMTRGMLVDLSSKLGAPMARDVETMRKNLASLVGKGASRPAASSSSSSYGSAAAAPSSSSSSYGNWRTTGTPAAAASSTGGRFASYTGGANSSSSNGSRWGGAGSSTASGAASDAVFAADLAGFKIDELSQLARKLGVSLRNATKDSLSRELAGKLKVADLSKGQLVEILSRVGQPITGSLSDLQERVRASAATRQSGRSLAGSSRW